MRRIRRNAADGPLVRTQSAVKDKRCSASRRIRRGGRVADGRRDRRWWSGTPREGMPRVGVGCYPPALATKSGRMTRTTDGRIHSQDQSGCRCRSTCPSSDHVDACDARNALPAKIPSDAGSSRMPPRRPRLAAAAPVAEGRGSVSWALTVPQS